MSTLTQQTCRNSKMGVDQTTRFAANYLCEDGQETSLSSATMWACLEEKCTKEQRILFCSLLDG